ncbi:xanthine dehydrogenase family protein molybdopterin-binding subunit [Mangrovimicrobium sediminis]|uniref:Xanthine dehydrogenase family protein molybdopterin-binding subunit n=1 Tax=Mangrovimicrobium sediminis TaxID=2562682 RepID=A0A4Z0M9I1_9GAMM|nr:molybdopterin cofactor-binding domain-containing protein [Haliea sp. SAOS-164]TGD76144.1 xanthine dehydrogenase family protein molybdopterin-binding subunit [Haliea sp. SAOS-164]
MNASRDTPVDSSRRRFLINASVLAGGLALGIRAERSDAAQSTPWAPDTASGRELSAWIEITPEDAVIIRVPTPEIGNGAMTQAAMNVTEELACDWSKVRVEFCSMHRDFMEGGVYNRGFLPFFGGHGTNKDRLAYALQLGASARERLKAAAAQRWGVPVADVTAQDSVITHSASGRTLSYGALAADAASITLDAEPALKPQSEWTFLTKASPAKLHIPPLVRGEAVYGIDVQVPGMVHAALRQCPVHGGKLKSYKPEVVLDMPGVRAVVVVDPAKTRGTPVESQATWGFATNQVQSGVAVIADHYWQAKTALEALPVEWDLGAGVNWKDTAMIYAEGEALLDADEAKVLRESGDVNAVTGGRVVEHTYSTPYCENAMIEPLSGTAIVSAGGAEVWCPTQDMLQAYWVAVDETGLKPETVRMHQTYVGGRFGRSTQGDDVRMVVAVAKEYPGVPVKTIWSREDCFEQGRYRTPIFARYRAQLGEDGYPMAVRSRASFIGTHPIYQLPLGYDDQPYFTSGIIPNVHISRNNYPVSVMNGAYRGPCYNTHAFTVETFIDECAVAAGIDPLAYRLHLMSRWDEAWSDCLRVAAEKIGWGRKLPRGEGLGIAISSWPSAAMRGTGTVVCSAAHVAISRAGAIEVKRVDVAFDCGRVANADAVRSQIEGATLFGMNMTLNEQLTIRDGVTEQRNFDSYPMLRLRDPLPDIHVHFEALSGAERIDIIGEAPVGPIGPAIGNAIFQATGKRLRSTPFRNHDLSWS